MDPSLFYRKRSEGSTAVVSFLLLEALKLEGEQNPDATLEAALTSAYKTTYKSTPSRGDLESIAKVLEEDRDKYADVQKADKAPPKVLHTLASSLMEWIGCLQAPQLCYVLAGFDPVKAEILYCDTDFRLVNDMAEVHINQQMQQVQASYEAVLYGFGGKYEDDKSSEKAEEGVMDLSKGASKQQLSQLRNMGF